MNKYDKILDAEPLSAKDEFELTTKYVETKDPIILEKLVKANLRFVFRVANQYTNNSELLDELFSEGSIGLVVGINKFDPTRGFKLISYSVWWIRQAILAYLNDNGLIRKPLYVNVLTNKIRKFTENYVTENGFEPENHVIAKGLDISISIIKQNVLDNATQMGLYDSNLNDELDFLEGYTEDVIDDSINDEKVEELLKLIRSERGQYIIKYYYGIGVTEKSLNEIANDLDLTYQRVSQIKERILRVLKSGHIISSDETPFSITKKKVILKKKSRKKKVIIEPKIDIQSKEVVQLEETVQVKAKEKNLIVSLFNRLFK